VIWIMRLPGKRWLEAYASDASTNLELDYDLVCRIMDDLEREGKMEAVKGYEVGDSIHGHRIIAEARKISDPGGHSQERQAQSPEDRPDRERPGRNRQKRQMVRSGMISSRLIS